MIRFFIAFLLSILIISCSRNPRVGVVNPDEVAGLKSTHWTLIHATAPGDADLNDEDNWVPVQTNTATDGFDMQQESNWEEVEDHKR